MVIWTDERINELSEQADNLVMDGPYVNALIVKDMRDEYEAEIERLRDLIFVAHFSTNRLCPCEICTAIRAALRDRHPGEFAPER